MSQDLTPITRQLDAITAQLAYLTERQRRQEELFSELTPVARAAMSSATAAMVRDGFAHSAPGMIAWPTTRMVK